MNFALGIGIGLMAGVLGGMLGIGGGIVMIPGMVLLLNVPQHTAQGVSLAAIVLTALVGSIAHYRQGNVKLGVILWVAPSAVAFGLVGAYLAGMLDATILQRIFGLVLLLMGGRIILGR